MPHRKPLKQKRKFSESVKRSEVLLSLIFLEKKYLGRKKERGREGGREEGGRRKELG